VRGGLLQRNSRVVRFDESEPERVGLLKSIQDEGEDVDEARTGERVAVSIDGPTVGRQVVEGDELWVEIPEKHAKILEQELLEELSADERETLSMYLDRHRKRDPFWGK
jgi:translation initiation factor eaIF-5B